MAAIEGRNHSASVRATSALIVEFVERSAFLQRISQDGVLAFALLQRLSRRLHSLDDAYTAIAGIEAGTEPGNQKSPIPEKPENVCIYPGAEAVASVVPVTVQVVDRFPFIVGRMPSAQEQRPVGGADLCLNDFVPYRLSRAHFAIERLHDQTVIRDLNSHLGTKVNETYIGRYAPRDVAELRPGENIIVAGGNDSPYILKVIVPA